MKIELTRSKHNPVLEPTSNWWESKFVYNPAATIYRGKIILLYRAQGDDFISRIGYGQSSDGIHFKRHDEPWYDSPIDDSLERFGAEDPRATKIGSIYYILYTAASVYCAKDKNHSTNNISTSKGAPFRIRIGLAKTKDFKKVSHAHHIFPGIDTKNAVLFPEKIGGKYYIIHRIHPCMTLASSTNFDNWDQADSDCPRPSHWDSLKIGAGAPPIKTRYGWLLFYHGVDKQKVYRLGIMLIDKDDPSKILYRSPEPIMSPEKSYEKRGLVNNVVFTCGAVEWGDEYYVYYGAADRVVGLATIKKETIDELFESVLKSKK